MSPTRLTRPLLEVMETCLNIALASEIGAGDYQEQNSDHFERALKWVHEEMDRRYSKPKKAQS